MIICTPRAPKGAKIFDYLDVGDCKVVTALAHGSLLTHEQQKSDLEIEIRVESQYYQVILSSITWLTMSVVKWNLASKAMPTLAGVL